MLVDRANAKIAPARHGNLRLVEFPKECAQKIIRGAHALDLFVGCNRGTYTGGVYFQSGFVNSFNAGADLRQNICNKGYVADVWYIFNAAGLIGKNNSRNNGDSRILCPAYGNFPF